MEFPHAERMLWLEEEDSECKEGLWLLGFVLSMCSKYAKTNPSEWVICGFSTQEIEETEHFVCMVATMKVMDHDFAYWVTHIQVSHSQWEMSPWIAFWI